MRSSLTDWCGVRAGALSGLLSKASIKYGEEILPYLAVFSGVLSALLALFRVQRFIMYLPTAVMAGFSTAVALIIALNQLNFALGLPKLPRHDVFVLNVAESLAHADQTAWFSLLVFAVSFVALFLLVRRWGKVPWNVLLAVLGCVVGYFLSDEAVDAPQNRVLLQTLATRYGSLDLNLVAGVDYAAIRHWNSGDIAGIINLSLSVTLIAVIETLISARIAQMRTRVNFDSRREVMALGAANVVCGVVGSIPVTAALARTSLNINMQATSRLSSLVNAVFIALLSFALLPLFKYLPLPIIAAILVMVAVRMLEPDEIKHVYHADKPMFAILCVTAVACVLLDPTQGILIGGFISLLRRAGYTERVSSRLLLIDEQSRRALDTVAIDAPSWEAEELLSMGAKVKARIEMYAAHAAGSVQDVALGCESPFHLLYQIFGPLDYFTAETHTARVTAVLQAINPQAIRSLDMELAGVNVIDADGYEAIRRILQAAQAVSLPVRLAGARPKHAAKLRSFEWAAGLEFVGEEEVELAAMRH
jgi:MFS superfamily sulfate permease-like transporter